MSKDVKLTGGNITEVYRNKDKVLRKQGYWSNSIHRVLIHLEQEKFTQAPKFLGVDEYNRECLTFMPGNTIEPYPIDELDLLVVVENMAKILRKFHDSTINFKELSEDKWMLKYYGSLPCEVICHNDIAPYNITFIDGIPSGIIDFDTACPGPRIWDIVYALYRIVPLSSEVYDTKKVGYRKYSKELDSKQRRELIKVFFDSYGVKCPADFSEQLIFRLKALIDTIWTEAKNGNVVFENMIRDKHDEYYMKEIDFLRNHSHEWL